MKESKINMNRAPLTPEEIEAAKNFDAMANGKDPDPRKSWKIKLVAGLAAILAAIAVVFVMDGSKKPAEEISLNSGPVELIEPVVNPPIENVDVKADVYKIDATKGGVIVTPTGTKINVSARSFETQEGKLVEGEVEITFREFHDVPSIFAAGIPMDYDSAGINYQFESAGMFEIWGNQKGNKVNIKTGKEIEVELVSQQTGDYFNIYKQNEDGTWNYIEKDTSGVKSGVDSTVTKVTKNDVKQAKKELDKSNAKLKKELARQNILVPEQADDDLYSMALQFKPSEFPELSNFKNVIFQITENNDNFEPEMASNDWDDIRLSKGKDTYTVTLVDDGKNTKLEVVPVFSEEDISGANDTFEGLFGDYDLKLEGKLKALRTERDSLNTSYRSIEAAYKRNEQRLLDLQAFDSGMSKVSGDVIRVFRVNDFGMWNSDCPSKLPKGSELLPLFVNRANTEDTLRFKAIYIAELGRNALFTLSGSWGLKNTGTKEKPKMSLFSSELSYDPTQPTVIWAVTTDAKLAVLKNEDFKLISKGGDYDIIPLEIIAKKTTSINDVKEALAW